MIPDPLADLDDYVDDLRDEVLQLVEQGIIQPGVVAGRDEFRARVLVGLLDPAGGVLDDLDLFLVITIRRLVLFHRLGRMVHCGFLGFLVEGPGRFACILVVLLGGIPTLFRRLGTLRGCPRLALLLLQDPCELLQRTSHSLISHARGPQLFGGDDPLLADCLESIRGDLITAVDQLVHGVTRVDQLVAGGRHALGAILDLTGFAVQVVADTGE